SADVPIVEPVARWAGDQDVDRVIVVDRRVEAATGAKDSSELEEPGILQITDVREDRASGNQPERIILKRKMRVGRCGGEPERRAEMILAPENMLGADVGAPDLMLLGHALEATGHPPRGTAEIENSVAVSEREPCFSHELHHALVMQPAAGEV